MMYIVRFGVGEDDYNLWDYVLENHTNLTSPGVRLLYITRRKGHGETSLILDSSDCDGMADLILSLSRLHPQINTISTLSMMKPLFFPVPAGTKRMERFTVTIECRTGDCENVYKTLAAIHPTAQNIITYITYTFMDGGRTILLSVLSKSKKTLKAFIEGNIECLEGVIGTKATRIVKTHKLIPTDEWKKRIRYNTIFEFLDGAEYEDTYLTNIIAGA